MQSLRPILDLLNADLTFHQVPGRCTYTPEPGKPYLQPNRHIRPELTNDAGTISQIWGARQIACKFSDCLLLNTDTDFFCLYTPLSFTFRFFLCVGGLLPIFMVVSNEAWYCTFTWILSPLYSSWVKSSDNSKKNLYSWHSRKIQKMNSFLSSARVLSGIENCNKTLFICLSSKDKPFPEEMDLSICSIW